MSMGTIQTLGEVYYRQEQKRQKEERFISFGAVIFFAVLVLGFFLAIQFNVFDNKGSGCPDYEYFAGNC